jgi:hypothetical protein
MAGRACACQWLGSCCCISKFLNMCTVRGFACDIVSYNTVVTLSWQVEPQCKLASGVLAARTAAVWAYHVTVDFVQSAIFDIDEVTVFILSA